MKIGQKAAIAIAIGCALALVGCGDKAGDDTSSTVTMDAVDVPQGTISDTLMPLDARDGSVAQDNSQAVAAPATTAPSNDNNDSVSDSESTADNEDDSEQ